MATCKHRNVIFYAWQTTRDGSKFILYNCLDCQSTIDLHILELDPQGIAHPTKNPHQEKP